MKAYLEILKDRNLKATPQRLSVLKALGEHTHPTMEELYDMIKSEHPSVSLATVYKNINTLIEEGLIVEINSTGMKSRYDIVTTPHIHVVCASCGAIEDYPCDIKFDAYQKDIEKNLKGSIDKMEIVATMSKCGKCK